MIPYHRIAARLYGRPLLLLPSTAQTVEGFIRGRIREGDIEAGSRGGAASTETGTQSIEAFQQTAAAGGGVEIHGARSSRFVGSTPLDASGRPLPFRRTTEGVAVITIVGELVNRGAWIGASSGLVSYEGISHQLRCAAADPQTTAIMLDIESPGGEAVGAFECGAAVRAAAAIKPVVAVVNGMAASAGYAIASGATRIITTPTGISGSIGVVMLHLDHSKMLADIGVEPTFIYAGDRKVDGNPYEPLPDDVKAEFQREIDAFYGLFVQSVAMGRGARLTTEMARATQAGCFMGEAAVAAGLADAVMTFDEALASMTSADPSRPATSRASLTAPKGSSMSTTTVQPLAPNNGADATAPASPPAASAPLVINLADGAGANPGETAAAISADVSAATPATIAEALAAVPTADTGAAAAAPDAIAALRAEAAAIIEIAAIAAKMGISVNAGDAIAKGVTANALREQVFSMVAAKEEASAVVTTLPAAITTGNTVKPATSGGKSPIVAAAEASRDKSLGKKS